MLRPLIPHMHVSLAPMGHLFPQEKGQHEVSLNDPTHVVMPSPQTFLSTQRHAEPKCPFVSMHSTVELAIRSKRLPNLRAVSELASAARSRSSSRRSRQDVGLYLRRWDSVG